ncbi:MAG: aspartate--tRNA ligase [Provencibacterium sp.]|jgi:aspartyl-tRNA synthetase|nr:aspartate--tRNA ligase [Provencibacterium sp.]
MDTMKGLKRTHYCGEVSMSDAGSRVVVAGFVQKTRELGNLTFIDLRDRTGIVQLAFGDETDREIFEKASGCRAEYVLMAAGVVRERESKNTALKNGDIEILVDDLRLLSKAQTPPFEINDKKNVKEELRLKHRYLDLRRPELQQSLMMRHRIVKIARDYFDRQGFLEIETPTLIKSTPEGARDYLVPSRVHPGSFYALPQSPQLYKQLLMLSGFDRYMQVARCYRDEDLRAHRQPEFTQIDLEMSFVDEQDVMSINEGFLKEVFSQVLGIEIKTPLRRIPYSEAMARFGSDKPDTRFGLELTDLSAAVKKSEFKVFSGALAAGGSVRGINAKGAADRLSRKEIDKLQELVKTYRAKGLAFTRLSSQGESSSFEKFLSPEETAAVRAALDAQPGDLLFIVADAKEEVVFDALGALRLELGKRLELIKPGSFDLLWVTEFPEFEYSEEEGRYVAKHHPFTAPMEEDAPYLESDPKRVRARAYDIVINGTEAGGGSIRINDPDLQTRMFKALGFTEERANEQFDYLLEAFKYGAPPHGGLAYGLDRLCMLLSGRESLKDVIAFPKVQNASELMSGAPTAVSEKALEELGIRLAETEE